MPWKTLGGGVVDVGRHPAVTLLQTTKGGPLVSSNASDPPLRRIRLVIGPLSSAVMFVCEGAVLLEGLPLLQLSTMSPTSSARPSARIVGGTATLARQATPDRPPPTCAKPGAANAPQASTRTEALYRINPSPNPTFRASTRSPAPSPCLNFGLASTLSQRFQAVMIQINHVDGRFGEIGPNPRETAVEPTLAIAQARSAGVRPFYPICSAVDCEPWSW